MTAGNPLQLSEALQHRTLALFLGADLPRDVTGLPSRTDLARDLARRHQLDESFSLAEVAQRVSQAGNRFEFTDFIRTALDTAGKSPSAFHQGVVTLVKEHSIGTIITTAYDNLLEVAFQQAGVGINRVVRGSDVSFIRPDRPTLIKLYGDAQQPETLVVTDRDHSQLLRDRDKERLIAEVRRAFECNTVVFYGYNLSDPDFKFLFDQIADSKFARLAYAVWPPKVPEADVRMWRDRGIVILEEDPLGVGNSGTVQPTKPNKSPEVSVSVSTMSSAERASLQHQLEQARGNLQLIEERQAEFVLGTDVPLQLVKEERRLRERIAELEQKLAGGAPPGSSPPPTAEVDLATGVVAIYSANGGIVGTGFVASERLIVTCAHVIEQAGGRPGETIGVCYHLNGAQQSAQVVAEWWRAPDADDIAVLQLAENLPAGVKPLKLGKSIGSERHAFRSLGYPNVGDYVGIVASGTIEAVICKADGRQMMQLTSSQLAQGHSGAPVWDEAQGCVIGMVSEVYHAGQDNKNRDTAFAAPTETLWQVCAELRQK